ncbi:hypothetical protein V6Z11_D13G189400 [Gossypium hirsutum]
MDSFCMYISQTIVAFFWCLGLLIRGLTSAIWEFLNFRPSFKDSNLWS